MEFITLKICELTVMQWYVGKFYALSDIDVHKIIFSNLDEDFVPKFLYPRVLLLFINGYKSAFQYP